MRNILFGIFFLAYIILLIVWVCYHHYMGSSAIDPLRTIFIGSGVAVNLIFIGVCIISFRSIKKYLGLFSFQQFKNAEHVTSVLIMWVYSVIGPIAMYLPLNYLRMHLL